MGTWALSAPAMGDVPSPIKDYRLTVSVRNNRLLRRIEDAGFRSVKAFCRHHDIAYHGVMDLIAISKSALTVRGEWRPFVEKLSFALGVLPEELFNDRQLAADIQSTKVTREVDEEELVVSLTGNAEALAIADDRPEMNPSRVFETNELAGKLLAALTPRQRQAVELRYGLGGGGGLSLDEIGEIMRSATFPGMPLSTERVRQLVLTAERKMASAARHQHRFGYGGRYIDEPKMR